MNLFGKKKQTRADPVGVMIVGEGGGDIIPGYTPLSQNQEVRRCIFRIADLVSNMTIMLMENGENGDIRVKDNLAKMLDVYPCKSMNRKNYIIKIVTDMMVYGNCVVVPIFEKGGIVDHKILKANSLRFPKDGLGYLINYQGVTYYSDEVEHFVFNPDDDNPYRGRGIAPMIKDTASNIIQANATKKSFLKSKWKPPMIISINTDAEEIMDKEKRKKILDSYTETTEQGEPWLIPAGEINVSTVKPLTLNDLSIKDGLELDLKALAGAIGVPTFMLGVGAFNKEEYNNFIATTIMSIATIIQQEITRKEICKDNQYVKFNPKSLMQYSLTEQIGFVKEMVGGGMLCRNEGRSEFDYSPVNDEEMNKYFVLENYIPVEKLGDQKKLKGGNEE